MDHGVLLVDDEASILKAISFLLRRAGYTVHITSRGDEALDLIKREEIGICFLDLRMPGMDGFEVCKAIKGHNPAIPVYAVSGHVSAYDPKELHEAGFDEAFPKPFDINALIEACERAFRTIAG